jgi:tetratricopeptide (TPR) repeat protein
MVKRPEPKTTESAETAFKAGLACGERGDFQGVIANMTRAIKANPELGAAYFYRGMAHGALDDYVACIEDLIRSVDLNEDLADSLLEASAMVGDDQGAALAQPTLDQLFEAYVHMARIFGMIKSYDQAFACFEEALDINPKVAEVYDERARCYFEMGNYPKAMADCNRALRLKPDDPGLLANRGMVYRKTGDLEQAIADFSRAIASNLPEAEYTHLQRGEVYFAQDRYDLALADFQLAAGQASTRTIGGCALALTQSALGRAAEAQATWRELAAVDPRFRDAAWLYSMVGGVLPSMRRELTAFVGEPALSESTAPDNPADTQDEV